MNKNRFSLVKNVMIDCDTVNFGFFEAITSPKRMAEKENRKSKRFQNTQNTPETRNIWNSKIEHVYLKVSSTMNNKKNPNIQFNTTLCVLESQLISSN